MLKSGIIVASLTLLSRISGLARELVVAYWLGISDVTDAINVAFRLPNLFRRIFAEGALSSAFIPIFSKELLSSKKGAENFSGKVFVLLLFTLTSISIFLQMMMPYIVYIIAPGLDKEFDLAVILCRISIIYLPFISITALIGGMLNSIGKFVSFAFVPVILNLCIILSVIIYDDMNFSFIYGLVIAGILQTIFMYLCLRLNGFRIPIIFAFDKKIKILTVKIIPGALSSGVQQVNLLISQSIASFFSGAISILSYADRIYQLPISIIGTSLGTILLPTLANKYKARKIVEANILQNKAICISMFLSIPAMFGLFILSSEIVEFLYQRGEFNSRNSQQVANILSIFALGLPAFVLSKILMPIFYANLDMQTPLRITIYSIITNTLLNIFFMFIFGYHGIAIGSIIASWFNLYLIVKKCTYIKLSNNIIIFISKSIISTILMSIGLILIKNYYPHQSYNGITKFFILSLKIIFGIFLYIISSLLLKIKKTYIEINY